MIYFIHGNSKKTFEKARALVDSMLEKRPDSEVFKITTENFNEERLSELIGSQSLFTQKYIVQVSHVLDVAEIADALFGRLEEMAESPNIFVWAEPKVDAKTLKKIEKVAEKVQELKDGAFAGGARGASERDNSRDGGRDNRVFALADALGQRDVKKLWLLYLEELRRTRPEEIHGVLWWQLKSMILAAQSQSPKEAGLKPFVYTKSRKFSDNYSAEELTRMADGLVALLHESRRGGAGLAERLEKWVLGV